MFCPNCGKEVTDGAKFCIYCGKPVSTDTSQESTFEDSPANAVIQDAQDQDVGLEVENQNIRTSIPEKKKSSHPEIIIGLAAVAVCIALGVGLRYYHDYQLKVKAAEIYKERFGIEIDPNDLTLYDNLQDAMADDSWQGGNSPTLTESPIIQPTEKGNANNDYEYYQLDNIFIPVPVGFKEDYNASTPINYVFAPDADATAIETINVHNGSNHINDYSKEWFTNIYQDANCLSYRTDNYEYYNIIRCITTSSDDMYYNFYVVLLFDSMTIEISMNGPEQFIDVFSKCFSDVCVRE